MRFPFLLSLWFLLLQKNLKKFSDRPYTFDSIFWLGAVTCERDFFFFFCKNSKERRRVFFLERFSVEWEGREGAEVSFLLAAGDTHLKVDPTLAGGFSPPPFYKMLPFQLYLLVFLRITVLSLGKPVPLEETSSVKQPLSVSSPSLSDDSIPSSSTTDLILSSNDNLFSNQNDVTPDLLTTARDSSSWVGGKSLPQLQLQQQQTQAVASCGGAPNRKRAEAGQQLDGAGGGGGEGSVCEAPSGFIAPAKAGETAQESETAKGKKEEEPGEFYNGGGSRRGPTQIFPTDEDVRLQNEMQAAKNRRLDWNDPSRCAFAPFFVHTCCSGELGPKKFDEYRGGYYQFVGSCILRKFVFFFFLFFCP